MKAKINVSSCSIEYRGCGSHELEITYEVFTDFHPKAEEIEVTARKLQELLEER